MASQTSEPNVKPSWKLVGPGLVVAATGVGAADLVATLVAGARFGYVLLWAVVLGCLLKIVLVEGVGRWTLATGTSIYEGWAKLGKWTSVYFVPYIIIWGFVYGAAAMSGSGLGLNALFPILPTWAWGMLSGVVGAALVWFGRYSTFERICAIFVGVMFITVCGAAILTVPNLGEIFSGLVPRLPEGSTVYVLSLAGGVGGTITLAAYGYWLREKGWSTPRFMKVMRIDNTMAYVVTGIFVIATLIVGAELLYSAGQSVQSGDKGLVELAGVLESRYGVWASKVFLIGLFAVAFSSLIGVWNGVSLMFADFLRRVRKESIDSPKARTGGVYYKIYILWLTFPPMIMLPFGRPEGLIIAYTVLGAFFMPFLGLTLIFLLNSKEMGQWKNRWYANVGLVLIAALFAYLGFNELIGAFTGD
ncbi:Nramp family divalent metal transporter [Naumannella halotolerans]|uniref:Mn2+/Fe2+ NRAMP family transporter n=1 Tax=Naumannella halotolerans TaxID=993414 RepID=A0A4V3EN66_9ACTN|nr:Nramp family divalent metal transporter [Naumannella halotolerans]TDT32668.1 Mn2+/Fe2+ NRAMP family transporter [Naumannella halotolerans]